MKTINDLTHEELINLTEEQIQFYINLAIAEEGIKPCPVPIEPNLINSGIVATEVFYEFGGTFFKNKADAVAVSQMEIFRTEYDYGAGYSHKWAERNIDGKIEERRFYKKEDVLRVAGLLQDMEKKRGIYNSAKSEYDKYLRKTTSCREHVWNIVNDAKDKEERIQNAQKAIENYKELAQGDEEVALRFFEKAFNDEPQEIKEIALNRLGITLERDAKQVS